MTKEQMEVVAISLLTTKTIEEVIQKTGISRSSIERVRKTDKFNLILESKKHEMFNEAMLKMTGYVNDAVETLHSIMMDSSSTSSARVSAASKIIDKCDYNEGKNEMKKGIDTEISAYLRLAELCGTGDDAKRSLYMKKVESLLAKAEESENKDAE